ncbi:MAG: hypothetical protein WC447_02705 [Candidatus Paceibacterota bacterium]
MKKGTIFVLLIVFLVSISAKIVFAYSFLGGVFGGKIINTKATEVTILEATGYVCPMSGTSISITPIGSPIGTPTDYFIPSYITSKTRTTPTMSQLILGRYSGQTMITCTNPAGDVQIVSLDTINLFGTSRY